MFHFDGTIRAGDLISLVGFIVVGLGAYHNIKGILKLFGYRLDIIDASIDDLKIATKNGNLQDAEISRLKDDMNRATQHIFELQRGQGYVQRELSGEYTRTGKVK